MDYWRKKKKPKSDIVFERGAMLLEDLIKCCDGKSNPIKFFSADDIRKATDNFSESNRISDLLDGYKWYSGKTENHHKILIKKDCGWSDTDREGKFYRDIAVSSMVSGHKNFLKLVGCCLEFKDPVMVYSGVKKDYNLDISEHPWERRMKIAEDIATSLAYLHTAFPKPFVYRTLSHQNIILDEDGVAKLRDFSFCISIPKGKTFVKVDGPAGLYNLGRDGVVSEKTDVFSIGMLVLTLLTGKERFLDIFQGEGHFTDYDNDRISKMRSRLQSWLSKFKEEREPKMGEISEEEFCKMKAFRISLRCVGLTGEVPTMVEVAKELKKIQRSLRDDSSSGETQYDYAQDVLFSVSPFSSSSS